MTTELQLTMVLNILHQLQFKIMTEFKEDQLQFKTTTEVDNKMQTKNLKCCHPNQELQHCMQCHQRQISTGKHKKWLGSTKNKWKEERENEEKERRAAEDALREVKRKRTAFQRAEAELRQAEILILAQSIGRLKQTEDERIARERKKQHLESLKQTHKSSLCRRIRK